MTFQQCHPRERVSYVSVYFFIHCKWGLRDESVCFRVDSVSVREWKENKATARARGGSGDRVVGRHVSVYFWGGFSSRLLVEKAERKTGRGEMKLTRLTKYTGPSRIASTLQGSLTGPVRASRQDRALFALGALPAQATSERTHQALSISRREASDLNNKTAGVRLKKRKEKKKRCQLDLSFSRS